jgi:tRNA A-37 threonylcarbamoyl transferase component Bud32
MDKLTDPFKNSKYGNQIAKLFTQMIVGGVFHNDIHAENLMAKGGRLYLIDFDNATLIPGMTKTEFDDTMKYHTSYTDETYSKRIPITFSKAQQSAIQKVRNGLLDK